jgi:hypothetical protein
MDSFLSLMARYLPKPSVGKNGGVARGLLEAAEARAGTNPVQAQELRSAACAYLRVVR